MMTYYQNILGPPLGFQKKLPHFNVLSLVIVHVWLWVVLGGGGARYLFPRNFFLRGALAAVMAHRRALDFPDLPTPDLRVLGPLP